MLVLLGEDGSWYRFRVEPHTAFILWHTQPSPPCTQHRPVWLVSPVSTVPFYQLILSTAASRQTSVCALYDISFRLYFPDRRATKGARINVNVMVAVLYSTLPLQLPGPFSNFTHSAEVYLYFLVHLQEAPDLVWKGGCIIIIKTWASISLNWSHILHLLPGVLPRLILHCIAIFVRGDWLCGPVNCLPVNCLR